MPEMTVNQRSPLMPQVRHQRYLVDPVAFVIAMIAGPVLVAIMGFWLVLIPVFALSMGGPFYLIIGVPVLLWDLSRNPASANRISYMALGVVLGLCALALILALLTNDEGLLGFTLFYAIFGAIFAPLWGLVTGKVYLKLRRDFYAHPLAL